jgi:DNA invertase Pin-like site-specific DNA recombinase
MFRSAWDALNVILEFQRQQISLWLLDLGGDVSGDGIAKLVLTILAAIAEFEREPNRRADSRRQASPEAHRAISRRRSAIRLADRRGWRADRG